MKIEDIDLQFYSTFLARLFSKNKTKNIAPKKVNSEEHSLFMEFLSIEIEKGVNI